MNKLNLITFITILVYITSFAQDPNYRKDDETIYQPYLPDENQEYQNIKLAVNFVFLHGGTVNGRDYYGNFDKNNQEHLEFIEYFKADVKQLFKEDFVDKFSYGENIDQSIFEDQYLNNTTIELDINTMWVKVENNEWDYTSDYTFEVEHDVLYPELIDKNCNCDYFYSEETSEVINFQLLLNTPINPPTNTTYRGKDVNYTEVDSNYNLNPVNTLIPNQILSQEGLVIIGYDVFYTSETSEIIVEEQVTIPENVGYNEIFVSDGNRYIRLESPEVTISNLKLNQLHERLRVLDQIVKDNLDYKKGVNVYFHENGEFIEAIDNGAYSDELFTDKLLGVHMSELPTKTGTENLYSYISSVFTQYYIYANGLTYNNYKPSLSGLNNVISNGYKRTTAHEITHNLNLQDHGSTVYLAEVDGLQTKVEYVYGSSKRVEDTNQNKDLRHSIFDKMRSPNSERYEVIHLDTNHELGGNVKYALNTIKHAASRYKRISQHFTNDSFDNTNLYVSQDVNEIWDFYYRSYSNIIVDGNKNLRVNDSLVMAPQSKIGIKNNSYVVLDSNSKLNPLEYNNIEWKGFEIEDNSYLLIKPDAKIPDNFNAEIIEQGMSRLEIISFNENVPQNSITKATNSVLDEEDRSSILYQSIKNSSITVNPNPADNYIKISSESIPIKTVMITDMNGQLIKKTNENFDNIDISGISNGIYILNITTVDNNTEFKKVIIE